MGFQCMQGTEESAQAQFASKKAASVTFACFKMNPAMSFMCGMKIQLVKISPKGITGDGYLHVEMHTRQIATCRSSFAALLNVVTVLMHVCEERKVCSELWTPRELWKELS